MSTQSLTEDDDEEDMQVDEDEEEDKRHKREKPKAVEKVKRARRLTLGAMPLHLNDAVDEEDLKEAAAAHSVQTPPCSPLKHLNNSASPVGVNRRTAVLFTRKAQAALKRPADAATLTTPVKEELSNTNSAAVVSSTVNSTLSALSCASTLPNSHNAMHSNAMHMSAQLGSNALTLSNKLSLTTPVLGTATLGLGTPQSLELSGGTKSPKRNARHKRLSEMRHSASLSPKKSPNSALSRESTTTLTGGVGANSSELNLSRIPDSFRVYRANNERDVSESDDDDMSDLSGSPCSSCSGFSVTGSGSEYDTSDVDEDEEERVERVQRGSEDEADEDEQEPQDSAQTDVEMLDVAASGNGAAMSCSGEESGSSDEALAARVGKRRVGINGGMAPKVANRTPTPSEKRLHTAWGRGRPRVRAATPSPTPSNKQASKFSAKKQRANSRGHEKAATPTAANHTRAARGRSASAVNPHKLHKQHNNTTGQNAESEESTSLLKPPLEPLQLVWAKCRGYPWYPALILDPKTPKGFVYNGVPLPAPPADVLALRKNYTEDVVFLVLFFDVKRTWQWLPAQKLEILGIDKQLDQQKLVESRKPTERKAVKKAYQDALHYQSQVSDLEGQGPDPIM